MKELPAVTLIILATCRATFALDTAFMKHKVPHKLLVTILFFTDRGITSFRVIS
jgi:hypothetical protein